MNAVPNPEQSRRVPLYQLSEIKGIIEPHRDAVVEILRGLSGAAASMQSYHDIEGIYQQVFGKPAVEEAPSEFGESTASISAVERYLALMNHYRDLAKGIGEAIYRDDLIQRVDTLLEEVPEFKPFIETCVQIELIRIHRHSQQFQRPENLDSDQQMVFSYDHVPFDLIRSLRSLEELDTLLKQIPVVLENQLKALKLLCKEVRDVAG